MWLYGGKTDDGLSDELWSLDTETGRWSLVNTANGPSARSSHDAVWDNLNDRLIVFGGKDAEGALDDLWFYMPETGV